MKIEITTSELSELIESTVAPVIREMLLPYRAEFAKLQSDMDQQKTRIDHHDSLHDIAEMRAGGQPIFLRAGQ